MRTARSLLIATALMGATLGADPQPAPTPFTWAEASAATDHLSNGSPDWSDDSVAVVTRSGRKAFYAVARRSRRFGISDPQYLIGAYLTPSAQTILNLEFATSPTHGNLPSTDIAASLDHRLERGWGYAFGIRQKTFADTNVALNSVGVDRYWKSYHAGCALTGTRISNVPGIALGRSLTFTRYYGRDELSSFGVFASAGRDAENIAGKVSVSAVSSEGLTGVHWFPRAGTALTWSASVTQQGRFYTRSEMQIGLRRRL